MYDKEFKVFLGVVILIGVLYKSNNESVAQQWSTLDGRPIFNRTMSRGRYQEILRVLRFDNAQSRRHHWSRDKLQQIRKVFETRDSYLRDSYTCRPSMTVHEQLVCFRGQCPFKQFISSKQIRNKTLNNLPPLALTYEKCKCTLEKMLDRTQKLIKGQRLFFIWQKIMIILAETSLVIISSLIYRLYENFFTRISH